MKTTLKLSINMLREAGISRTSYLSIETISRPPQSHEAIPLMRICPVNYQWIEVED
jgi:hypothetical protein